MDAKIEIAQVNGQALSNSVVGDVLIYATSNLQNVLVGQSNSLPALRCQGANVSTGANLTVAGNLNFMGSILQSNAPFNTGAPSGYALVTCQKPGGSWDYAINNTSNINSVWSQRVVNTVSGNVGSLVDSVTNNQIWLKQGTYSIDWRLPIGFHALNQQDYLRVTFKSRLRNATTATDLGYSSPGVNLLLPWSGLWYNTDSCGSCMATVATSSNALELWHMHFQLPATSANAGGFNGSNIAVTPFPASMSNTPEIFAQVAIRRVA